MTAGKSSELLPSVNASKDIILRQLADYYQGSAPEEKILAAAKPEDLHITEICHQGMSRATYLLSLADLSFVLSVNLPRQDPTKLQRADTCDAQVFQQHLKDHALPVPAILGPPFRLPHLGHICALSTFLHGYQVPAGIELSTTELDSMAETQAKMHLASNGYAPPGYRKPPAITATRLPQGFVHADLCLNNFIFDGETHKVLGVIDFEFAHYNTFAYDTARLISFNLIHITGKKDGLHMDFDHQKAMRFMEQYCRHRPISTREAKAISDCLVKVVDTYARDQQCAHSLPEDQLEAERAKITARLREEFHPENFAVEGINVHAVKSSGISRARL